MKRLMSILFLVALTFTLSSCSSDDDSPASDDIIGIWQYNQAGGILNGEEFLIPWESECPGKIEKMEFLSNSVVKDYRYYEDCNLYLEEGNWSYSGNILTITANGETNDIEILLLTQSRLKMKITEEDFDLGHIIIEFKRI